MKKLFDSAVFLAVATAVLYSWGTAYYHGYINALNLDADLMERTANQTIYFGFITSIGFLSIILVLIVSILFIYSHGILPAYIDYIRMGVHQKRKIIKLRKFLVGTRIAPDIEVKAKKIFNLSVIYLFVAIVYLSTLVYVEGNGKSKALMVINNHLSLSSENARSIFVRIGKEEKKLQFLACGYNNCAGIENVSNIIYYYSSSGQIHYIFKK